MQINRVPDITELRGRVETPERELANKIGYAIEEKKMELISLKDECDTVLGVLEDARRMSFDLRSDLIDKAKEFYDSRIENTEEEIRSMNSNVRRLMGWS